MKLKKALWESITLIVVRVVLYSIVLYFIGKLLKIYSPVWTWEQIGTMLAIIAFAIKFYDDADLKNQSRMSSTESDIRVIQTKLLALESASNKALDHLEELAELRNEIDKLTDKFVAHTSLYLHPAGAQDFRELQQEFWALEATAKYRLELHDLKNEIEFLKASMEVK